MEYNDFQLFDDKTFSILQQHYNENKTDRRTYINKIYLELESCSRYCCTVSNRFNKRILTELNTTKTQLDVILQNLKATFSLTCQSPNSYKEFNLFKLLKKIFNTLSLLNNWQQIEEKEYYKLLIKKSTSTLIDACLKIISACEESEIKFFKYM